MFVLLISLTAFKLHKEYHSLTEINFNNKEKTIEITMRLFTNDLDLALLRHFEKNMELGTEKETSDANRSLEIYLNQKFLININNTPKVYQFLGKEFEKDEMYVYLEIQNIDKIQQISVQNSVLTEVYFEQENTIKLHINDLKESLILTKENDKGMLNF